MDKIRQQKLEQFLAQKDREIKEMNDFSMLEKGDSLLVEIEQFEDENAEFLQQNGEFQDELNKRKCTINFILFPIISDEKVEELLQYHILDAIEANLDIEFLMKERAITTSELLWPKLAQEYLKALSQNTQLIGSEPLLTEGDKNSFLPYVKNWISLYTRRFGIEKHTGLETHQFILENSNTRRLTNKEKESLIKVLGFYENLKVYSLSEIETEMRKVSQMMANSFAKANAPGKQEYQTPEDQKAMVKKTSPIEEKNEFLFPGDKIRFKTEIKKQEAPTERILVKKIVEETVSESEPGEVSPLKENSGIERASVLELMEKYPEFKNQKITQGSIVLKTAPFSLSPTLLNWVNHYFNECGKGRHKQEDRERFVENLKSTQNLSPEEIRLIRLVFLSLDERVLLSMNTQSKKIVIDNIGIGEKIRQSVEEVFQQKEEATPPPTTTFPTKNSTYSDDDLDLEFIPGEGGKK